MTIGARKTAALLQTLEETLGILQQNKFGTDTAVSVVSDPLPSLFEQCQQLSAHIAQRGPEPIRTIHHFACTGGTLFSKHLAVLPNVRLFSELDPLSTLHPHTFNPTDLAYHLGRSMRQTSASVVTDVFLKGLEVIHRESQRNGERTIIRDHTHSHFCCQVDYEARPTMRHILAQEFTLRSIVTVRHPLESFLSLRSNGWVQFLPDTLEEYSKRYLAFLAAYEDVKLFKYEDFLADPARILEDMAQELEIPFPPDVLDLAQAIELTGDSGRSGIQIKPRPRRPVPELVTQERNTSDSYAAVCALLKYDP